ncbi:hypothetical protein ASF83_17985 [Plantibacter sp. Leaf171]|nr:hypothetical protein ASE44_18025 [Plantibacter sp. Leaf1]KQR56764.1 hypothetical protein ASF83_17985 [Plantibacter sp. Leaf171]
MVFPGEVTSNPFPQSTVDAVLAHMNGDHPDDNLLIVRAFLEPAAEAATMISLDETGGEWTWTVDGTAAGGRVPWPAGTISGRGEIRREVVALYDTACERLRVEPRPHD